jgi:transmembrane sensor
VELQEIQILLDKYLAGTASDEERIQVENWYENIHPVEAQFNETELAEFKTDMRSVLDTRMRKPTRLYWTWAAAAVLLIGMGIAFYNGQIKPKTEALERTAIANDIPPGGNNAILTLGDGSTIVLNDAKDGKLGKEGNVLKKEDGLIAYTASDEAAKATLVYNSIYTPRGGQYAIVLADGTKVWLNAASSLKFPTTFNGKQRAVELYGEAYFEVAKNAAMPFRVISKEQTIEVLGTHFNINTYAEEAMAKTTLLEGSVKVMSGKESALLKPGEEAVIQHNLFNKTANIQVNKASNLEAAIAWKNGFFQFDEADIKTVMNQIGRWYDVTIAYENGIPNEHYNGKVPRNVNVSQALKILELSGINFKIEGKKIIVK